MGKRSPTPAVPGIRAELNGMQRAWAAGRHRALLQLKKHLRSWGASPLPMVVVSSPCLKKARRTTAEANFDPR